MQSRCTGQIQWDVIRDRYLGDIILDRNLTMWYLVLSWHRNLSWHLSLSEFSSSSCYFDLAYLSCYHAYVHLSFSCQLTLLVFMLIVDRAYSVFLTDPFCFASFLPSPPPGYREEILLFSSDFFCLKVIMDGLDFSWLWLLYCFYLGNNLWKSLYASLLLQDRFWCILM